MFMLNTANVKCVWLFLESYCWWKKSCTSWYVVYPITYKVLYIPGAAGILPSTVVICSDIFMAFVTQMLFALGNGTLCSTLHGTHRGSGGLDASSAQCCQQQELYGHTGAGSFHTVPGFAMFDFYINLWPILFGMIQWIIGKGKVTMIHFKSPVFLFTVFFVWCFSWTMWFEWVTLEVWDRLPSWKFSSHPRWSSGS